MIRGFFFLISAWIMQGSMVLALLSLCVCACVFFLGLVGWRFVISGHVKCLGDLCLCRTKQRGVVWCSQTLKTDCSALVMQSPAEREQF
ncbi:uncharacterized protein YALI1_F15377g [Yarrowia lipolytica]|uniref:Uncharacterized protein n=1 Tax=Yarrowia lipolytica TaxID=4952 RepID=A0A1D8NN04_YARLL|nr:hypothetical protein YALI1_F15377g [Yarrowia lipolytica]